MSCCGQARHVTAVESTGPGPDTWTRLEYTGDTAILVRGPSSGHPYQFSPRSRVNPVHRADATVLLQTGYFRTA